MIVSSLLLSSMLVAAAGSSAPPDGTYTYNLSLNGTRLGKSTVTLSHSGTNVRLDENSSAVYNGTPASATATMVLDAGLAPTGYTASYTLGGQSGRGSISFNGASANVSGPMGTNTFPLSGGATHFAVLDGALTAGFFILPAQLRAWSGAPTALSPMNGQSVSLQLDARAKPGRPATVPANDTGLSVGGQLPFIEWYDPGTLLVDEIDVPSQNVVAIRVR